MNILFVSYGEITNNTGSQFTVVARELSRMGHHCVAAVPKIAADLSYSNAMGLPCRAYKEVLAQKIDLFPKRQKADLLVAITPRQIVHNFLTDYFCHHNTPLIIHLEDNEDELTERFTLRSIAEIRNLPHDQVHEKIVPPGLSCPLCWPDLLNKANGLTFIHPSLRQLAPTSLPSHHFTPPIDFDLFNVENYRNRQNELRNQFKIAADENIVSYTGNTHDANIENIRSLYSVVHQLNRFGSKTRLLRTGNQGADFHNSLPFDARPFTTDLGFIPRLEVPAVIAVADLIILPTHCDNYDNYRLPSSLPEHLAMGKCVITTKAGLGAELQDGVNAAVLEQCKVETLLARSMELFDDEQQRTSIGENAQKFAQQRFHQNSVVQLEQFYQTIANSPT